MNSSGGDPVAAVVEAEASGVTAAIFADIRETLGVGVVNLIWRHLATMHGALPWAWSAVKPLYLGPLGPHAASVRASLPLPAPPPFTRDVLSSAGVDATARADITNILDSYHHTNALALVALSALVARFENASATGGAGVASVAMAPSPPHTPLPTLLPLSNMAPHVARLVEELNSYGEDADPGLVASMYRHLAHWPAYLALMRTLLSPLQADGRLQALTVATRELGRAHGNVLASSLPELPLLPAAAEAIAACRRFVEHPVARMVGVCALIRASMPE